MTGLFDELNDYNNEPSLHNLPEPEEEEVFPEKEEENNFLIENDEAYDDYQEDNEDAFLIEDNNIYEDYESKDDEVGFFIHEEDDYEELDDENLGNEGDGFLGPLEEDFTPPPPKDAFYTNSFYDNGWIGQLNLDLILSHAIEDDASDIHLTADEPVAFTKYKEIIKKNNFPIPTADELNDLGQSILTNVQNDQYLKNKDFDFSYRIKFGRYVGRRFRVNIGRSFDTDFLVFRTISDVIPSPEELEIPEELINWVKLPSGVWLIGGATGSGKSTTLASLLYYMQMNYPKKIITIEKPIEYEYPKNTGKALIVQREVGDGQDTKSFYNGITASLRENPDIILLGEVRDTEEVSELIRAAETGHLAISTIHTNSVPTTLNRIFSLFKSEEQDRVRSTLSDTLKGLMNQNLVKRKDGKGVFAVREILTITNEIRKYIANGDVQKIREYMIRNEKTMEHELIKAYKEDKCTYDEAFSLAPDQELFLDIMNGRK